MIRKLTNKDLNISIITVVITVTLQLFFIWYASYNIAKVDYGNFVLLQTLIAGLSAIFLQIPAQAFDRFYNNIRDKKEFINEFRTLLIGINVISIFIIMIYGYFFNQFSFQELFILFIYFVLLNTYELNQKVFLLNMERGKYFYLKILEAIAKFLFPILLYIYFHSLEALMLGIVFGYVLSHVILNYYLKDYKYSLIFKWNNLKKYFLFAYPIVFVSIFTWGISFSDRYFINYFSSTEDVAIYSLLAMVAGVGQVVGQIYFMYAEPKILKQYEENSEIVFNMIGVYLIRLTFIFSFLFILALLLPRDIYTILLEKEIIFNNYYFITLLILLVAIFVNILHIAHHMHLKLMKRLDILAYILFISFLINLLGNLFIAKYGIMAAALSTLIAYISILSLQILYVNKSNNIIK